MRNLFNLFRGRGMSKPELGDVAKDIVTGFQGVVTAHARYLTGCDQYALTPESTDGKVAEGAWFDENRLSVIQTQKVVIPTPRGGEKTGGPQHTSRKL